LSSTSTSARVFVNATDRTIPSGLNDASSRAVAMSRTSTFPFRAARGHPPLEDASRNGWTSRIRPAATANITVGGSPRRATGSEPSIRAICPRPSCQRQAPPPPHCQALAGRIVSKTL
jgi:hypothetical protein